MKKASLLFLLICVMGIASHSVSAMSALRTAATTGARTAGMALRNQIRNQSSHTIPQTPEQITKFLQESSQRRIEILKDLQKANREAFENTNHYQKKTIDLLQKGINQTRSTQNEWSSLFKLQAAIIGLSVAQIIGTNLILD